MRAGVSRDDPEAAVVAYRYSVTDIDRWPEPVVQAFYNHLRTKDEHAQTT